MGKVCPLYGVAIYMDCLDCDKKVCRMKYKTICIGVDQSYNNTGISISVDGKLLVVKSIQLNKCKTNSDKRKKLRKYLYNVLEKIKNKSINIVCVIERIRLRSQGFINIDYIKSIGALNSVIVDVMSDFNIQVYSVDTRCWKSQVVGTSKPSKNNFGVPDEKWPTVKWCLNKGFIDDILIDMSHTRKTKGTFVDPETKKRMMFNNDAADSAAISMFWFVGEHDKLKLEK